MKFKNAGQRKAVMARLKSVNNRDFKILVNTAESVGHITASEKFKIINSDTDRDGVKNKNDSRPFDKTRQGKKHLVIEDKKVAKLVIDARLKRLKESLTTASRNNKKKDIVKARNGIKENEMVRKKISNNRSLNLKEALILSKTYSVSGRDPSVFTFKKRWIQVGRVNDFIDENIK